MRDLLDLVLPAKAESLKPMRDALDRVLVGLGVGEDQRAYLKLVVDEAAANVIRHAYGGSEDGVMRLIVGATRGRLRLVLRDRAPPIDPARIKPRDLSDCRPGGLGINFIDSCVDCWRIAPLRRGAGNRLTMYKRLRDGR